MNTAVLSRVIDIAGQERVAIPGKSVLRTALKRAIHDTFSNEDQVALKSHKTDEVERMALRLFVFLFAPTDDWAAIDALEDGAPVAKMPDPLFLSFDSVQDALWQRRRAAISEDGER